MNARAACARCAERAGDGPSGVLARMSKIPGLGELLEGVLERDPLDETYQIRVLESGGQRVIRLQDVLSEYEGSEVRFTIAFARALTAAAEALGDQGAQAVVSLDDPAKGN